VDYCYVARVRTGSEEKTVHGLVPLLDQSQHELIVPKIELSFRRHGIETIKTDIAYRGYVFIRSGVAPDEMTINFKKASYIVKSCYHLLCYGDNKTDIVMKEGEWSALVELFGPRFVINKSEGFIIGDTIRITKGPLIGCESKIKKINRHRQECIVEIEFMGDIRQITVGLEVIKKC
jgi:transcriptional antiterminator NusG